MHNMKPTDNDVLSGRGAWYNQHPGNVHFRKIIDEQKDAYMSGTKKQKMDISKAIVEAIYSMDPPGRFLKECPETGQWNELSKRDAADKAAQAMAYAVSGKERSKRRRERRQQSRQSRRSLPLSLDNTNSGGAISSQPVDGPGQHRQLHSSNTHQLESQRSSTAAHEREGAASHTSAAASTASPNNRNINPQQQLPSQLQQSNSATIPTSSASGNSVGQHVNQNLLAQALAQALQQQQEHLQRHHDQEEQPRRESGLEELLQMTQQLPPALLERLTQLLFQTQLQQLQQQQVIQQQQLLLQRLLPTQQQNGLPSVSLPTTLSSSAESPASQEAPPLNNLLPSGTSSSANGYSLASPFQPANNSNMFQLLQHQADPSYALLLGVLNNSLQHRSNNIGISGAPEVAAQQTQTALLPNSATLQQHLLASLWGAPLNPSLPQQQLQQSVSTLMDPLRQAWETALLRLPQNTQNPSSADGNEQPPVTAAAAVLTRQGDGMHDEQSEPEENIEGEDQG